VGRDYELVRRVCCHLGWIGVLVRRCQLDWYAELETGPATRFKDHDYRCDAPSADGAISRMEPARILLLAALWMQNRGAGKSYAMRRAGVEAL